MEEIALQSTVEGLALDWNRLSSCTRQGQERRKWQMSTGYGLGSRKLRESCPVVSVTTVKFIYIKLS